MTTPHPPRPHHYNFAYKALPEFGLIGNPRALDILATPMGQPLLIDIWDTVAKELPRPEKMPPDDLICRTSKTSDGRRVIIVELPPARPAEARYVGFVTTRAKRKMLLFKEPAQTRCFALGVGESPGISVLTELKKDGSRVSLGEGPGLDLSAFVARIGEETS